MKSKVIAVVLVAVNCALALVLGKVAAPGAPTVLPTEVIVEEKSEPVPELKAITPQLHPPPTEYAKIYSPNPKQFVVNLRAIGCPEETIKDILGAEISRTFAAQEQALKPTPADHVPNGWSPRTVEGKLIARRQEAAAVARQKAAALQGALGYEVAVTMPAYAMTVSDQNFQQSAQTLPPKKRAYAQEVQDNYWAGVQRLRDRTRGFWLPEDVAELEKLKQERAVALERLNRM